MGNLLPPLKRSDHSKIMLTSFFPYAYICTIQNKFLKLGETLLMTEDMDLGIEAGNVLEINSRTYRSALK